MKADAIAVAQPSKLRDYWALSKPRVTILVWITTLAGMILAGPGWTQPVLLSAMLVGSWLVIAGANVLNQVIEAEPDAKMTRTANRPIPSGRVSRTEGLLLGIAWSVVGILLLALFVNLRTASLGACSVVLYALAYTPLKQRTHLATAIGAIPGAIPPLAGWVAVRDDFGAGGGILFAIQYVWQFPHFWAIAWLLREDYARAGFKMLPFPGATGAQTGRCAIQFALPLLPLTAGVAVVTFRSGYAWQAIVFGLLAFVLTLWLVGVCIQFARTTDDSSAKRVIKASVLYLPLLLLAMILFTQQ